MQFLGKFGKIVCWRPLPEVTLPNKIFIFKLKSNSPKADRNQLTPSVKRQSCYHWYSQEYHARAQGQSTSTPNEIKRSKHSAWPIIIGDVVLLTTFLIQNTITLFPLFSTGFWSVVWILVVIHGTWSISTIQPPRHTCFVCAFCDE